MSKFGIVIHGGAGTITKASMTEEKEKLYTEGLRNSIKAGWKVLSQNGTALDAVEASIVSLEDNPLFNAGKGSVFNNEGKHEMEASIMCGERLKAGSAILLRTIKNPIKLARAIMEKSTHVMLGGEGAEKFAVKHNIQTESEDYFFDENRYNQYQKTRDKEGAFLDHTENFGTVGAAALDINGNLAAATSTGGMTNKLAGRIGDTPIIGAGNYANNNTCAVSCTGTGEYFMRLITGYDISCLIEYRGLSIQKAAEEVIYNKLKKNGGDGGLIAIDKECNIVMSFNSEGMYRGFRRDGAEEVIRIYKD